MKETLNLLPPEIKIGAPKRKGKFYYLFLGLTAYIIVMIGLWFFKIIEAKRFDAEITRLNKQKIEMQQKILPPPPPLPVVPSVDKEILSALERAPRWSRIISDISIITPKEVWLSSIESKEEKGIKRMNIKGFSTTQLGVADLISALETSQHFYDVEIVFAQKGEKDISFELKAKVRRI